MCGTVSETWAQGGCGGRGESRCVSLWTVPVRDVTRARETRRRPDGTDTARVRSTGRERRRVVLPRPIMKTKPGVQRSERRDEGRTRARPSPGLAPPRRRRAAARAAIGSAQRAFPGATGRLGPNHENKKPRVKTGAPHPCPRDGSRRVHYKCQNFKNVARDRAATLDGPVSLGLSVSASTRRASLRFQPPGRAAPRPRLVAEARTELIRELRSQRQHASARSGVREPDAWRSPSPCGSFCRARSQRSCGCAECAGGRSCSTPCGSDAAPSQSCVGAGGDGKEAYLHSDEPALVGVCSISAAALASGLSDRRAATQHAAR